MGRITRGVRCDAKSKHSGEQCKNMAVAGSSKCRMHGGRSLTGPLNPSFSHGRYSRVVPHNLTELYAQGMSDPDLLSLREELALLDARVKQLLAELPQGETASNWAELQDTWRDFIRAVRSGDSDAQNAMLPKINNLVTHGAADAQRWSQIFDLLERRRRLAETEHKRLVTNNQFVQVSTVLAMMGAMVQGFKDVVEAYVEDKNTRNRIYVEASKTYRTYLGGETAGGESAVTVDG